MPYEKLKMIGDAANEVLPEDYVIMDLVYRDADCGVFGKRGWGIHIGCPKSNPKWGLGKRFINEPTKEEVQLAIKDLIDKIEKARNKDGIITNSKATS